MSQNLLEVVDFGVDWFTCTANSKSSKTRLCNLGSRLIKKEAGYGNTKRNWGFEGYQGFKSGGVAVGTRDASSIVICTGREAREYWRECFDACDNVSRIDIQFTATAERSPTYTINRSRREAVRHAKPFRRAPKITLVSEHRGSNTLYLGKRVSENFGRIYDKATESSQEVWEGCVRFEREVKGNHALRLAKYLYPKRSHRERCLAEVQGFMQRRGVPYLASADKLKLLNSPRRVTDVVRKREWLKKQVRPTVEQLAEYYSIDEIANWLGLSQLKQTNLKLLKRA